MRLRAGVMMACVLLAGCRHLPDGVTIDLDNRTVAVGGCSCRIPTPAPVPAAPQVGAAAPDEPVDAPE